MPIWIAFVLGRCAATRSFTDGYRRADDLAGLFIVAMIALSAVLAARESIDRLFNPQEVDRLGLMAAPAIVGFIGNEIVALYRIRVGREIGSAALIADGYHARTDGLTSSAMEGVEPETVSMVENRSAAVAGVLSVDHIRLR